jgi:hypothetical protein
MLLHELVTATDAVTATSSRLAKVAALAAALRDLDTEEISTSTMRRSPRSPCSTSTRRSRGSP